jgi:hypothetical protein
MCAEASMWLMLGGVVYLLVGMFLVWRGSE